MNRTRIANSTFAVPMTGAEPVSAEERVLRGWIERRIGALDHEQRVAAHADRLFDLLAPLHKLDAEARRVLRWSALLHDVGRCVADDGHEIHGAQLLATDTTLPMRRTERDLLAYLTRRHRGKVPTDDPLLDDRASRRTTRLLLALLRAADALDNRRCEPPALLLMRDGRTIEVHAYAPKLNRHLRKLVRGRKKFTLLHETLDVDVRPQVHLAEVLTIAA